MADKKSLGWWYVSLLLLTVVGFGKVCSNRFVCLDDPVYAFHPMVARGLSLTSAEWALTSTELGLWMPVTWLSLALDGTLYGPRVISNDIVFWDQFAGGYHLTNLILHCVNVLLLFRLLSSATGCAGRSAMVAALFAIHPLRVESVAWVTERKDVLSGLFFLLTLLAYGSYVKNQTWIRFLLVLLLFAAGLGSKPSVVTLPCVLLLWDYWPLRRCEPKETAEGESLPPITPWTTRHSPLLVATMLLLAFAVSYATYSACRHIHPPSNFSLLQRTSIAVFSYGWYLLKTVLPVQLTVLYPLQIPRLDSIPMLLSLAALAGLSLLAYRLRLARPYLIVGWLWFLGVMLPVSGLFMTLAGTAFHNDRYTYLPHIGLFVMLVWGASDLLAAARLPARATAGLALAVLAVLLVFTMQQVADWKDSETLFTHDLDVTGESTLVLRPLVGYCLEMANSPSLPDHQRMIYFEKVLLYANKGLELNDPAFHIPLAMVYASTSFRNSAEARKHLLLVEDNQELTLALPMGLAWSMVGDHARAVVQFDRCLSVQPTNTTALLNGGRAYLVLNRYAEAADRLNRYVQINPTDPWGRFFLGAALLELADTAGGRQQWGIALKLAEGRPADQERMAEIMRSFDKKQ